MGITNGAGELGVRLVLASGAPAAHGAQRPQGPTAFQAQCNGFDARWLFGWKDGKTSKIYTEQAEQERPGRAAVLKINWGETENILP